MTDIDLEQLQETIDRIEGRLPSFCCGGKCSAWKKMTPAQKRQLQFLKDTLAQTKAEREKLLEPLIEAMNSRYCPRFTSKEELDREWAKQHPTKLVYLLYPFTFALVGCFIPALESFNPWLMLGGTVIGTIVGFIIAYKERKNKP